jgi:hypothetical protein
MDKLVAWHEYFVQLKCLVSCVTVEINGGGGGAAVSKKHK